MSPFKHVRGTFLAVEPINFYHHLPQRAPQLRWCEVKARVHKSSPFEFLNPFQQVRVQWASVLVVSPHLRRERVYCQREVRQVNGWRHCIRFGQPQPVLIRLREIRRLPCVVLCLLSVLEHTRQHAVALHDVLNVCPSFTVISTDVICSMCFLPL